MFSYGTTVKRRFLKTYKSDEVFLIEKAKRNDHSKTSIPYKKTNDQSQPQFP